MSLMRNIQYDSVYGNYFITIKAVGSVDMFVCASNVCVCVSQYIYIYTLLAPGSVMFASYTLF